MYFDITFFIVSLINSLAYMFSMTNPLLFQIRRENKLFISIYLFLFQVLVAPKIGQYVAIFMLGGVLLIIASSYKHYMINIAFSLLGFLVNILINHLLLFIVNIFGITTSQLFMFDHLSIIFVLVYSVLTYTATYYAGKFVRKKFALVVDLPQIVQTLFLVEVLCCAIVFVFHIIVSDNNNYPSYLILMNLILFTVLIGVTLVILFSCIYFIQKNEKIHSIQKEKQILESYAKKTEQFYKYTQGTKQNYTHAFSAIRHYIEEEDISNLKEFLDKNSFSENPSFYRMENFMDKLNAIKILELKSIFYFKLLSAVEKNLQITFNVQNEIFDVAMDMLDMSNIVEELMNNAIEAADASEEKRINILLASDDISFVIRISNSSLKIKYSLDEIYKKEVTSDIRHRGLGLYNVTHILNKYNNVIHSTDYDNCTFKQTIEICYTTAAGFTQLEIN